MSYSIVYSSKTGNTKLLAETVQKELPAEECVYFGEANEAALKADRIYVGYWTEKGCCDQQTEEFLKTVTDQEIYLFGTAGFGESQAYFDQVIKRTAAYVCNPDRIIGCYMCQGKMPMTVRQRYEKMADSPTKIPNLQGMIENFDRALTHPDQSDLEKLQASVRALL